MSFESRPWSGSPWRVVERQHRPATMRIVDTLDEQETLERLLEESKPRLPEACHHLHYLLAAPFRYAPYPRGSRFRRANQREGVFYASDAVETAIAETAFHKLLFFLVDAAGMVLPANAVEHLAFCTRCEAARCVDLTSEPFASEPQLTHPTDYTACQSLADQARLHHVEVIRYRSVRDPKGGMNTALLTHTVFASSVPEDRQSWSIFVRHDRVQAHCEFPPIDIEHLASMFSADPRIRAVLPEA